MEDKQFQKQAAETEIGREVETDKERRWKEGREGGRKDEKRKHNKQTHESLGYTESLDHNEQEQRKNRKWGWKGRLAKESLLKNFNNK